MVIKKVLRFQAVISPNLSSIFIRIYGIRKRFKTNYMPSCKLIFVLKAVCVFSLSVITITGSAQSNLRDHALQVTGGYSRHGSGDMKGIVFGTEYIKYYSRHFSLDYNFRAGINNAIDKIYLYDGTGSRTDKSIRFTTAGVQLGVNSQYSIIRRKSHEIIASLGAFGRYQSASNGSDGYSLYYPNQTGIPTVLVEYNNRTPQKTYSAGGLFQLQYNFTTRKSFIIGLTPGFQTDTNGDAIVQLALVLGKRF
jgi:hypothetical protein